MGTSKGITLADDISLHYQNDAVKYHLPFVLSGYPDTLGRSVALIVRARVCVGFFLRAVGVAVRRHRKFVSGENFSSRRVKKPRKKGQKNNPRFRGGYLFFYLSIYTYLYCCDLVKFHD